MRGMESPILTLISLLIMVPFVSLLAYAVFKKDSIQKTQIRLRPPVINESENVQTVTGELTIKPRGILNITNITIDLTYGMYIQHRLHAESVSIVNETRRVDSSNPLKLEFEIKLPKIVRDLNNYSTIETVARPFQILHPKPDPQTPTLPGSRIPNKSLDITKSLLSIAKFDGAGNINYKWRLVLEIKHNKGVQQRTYELRDDYSLYLV